ncbi:MAG TPA: hypothetical protein VKA94_08540, partial [Hyphomicrobiales bacterium]|nr:hypothetical protein [Hyphomicrobiales bacterium]
GRSRKRNAVVCFIEDLAAPELVASGAAVDAADNAGCRIVRDDVLQPTERFSVILGACMEQGRADIVDDGPLKVFHFALDQIMLFGFAGVLCNFTGAEDSVPCTFLPVEMSRRCEFRRRDRDFLVAVEPGAFCYFRANGALLTAMCGGGNSSDSPHWLQILHYTSVQTVDSPDMGAFPLSRSARDAIPSLGPCRRCRDFQVNQERFIDARLARVRLVPAISRFSKENFKRLIIVIIEVLKQVDPAVFLDNRSSILHECVERDVVRP